MTLRRTAVRHALQQLLKGRTNAGGNVKATRVVNWPRVKLPCISIYTIDESNDEELSAAPLAFLEQISVAVEFGVAQRMDDEANEVGEMDDDLDVLSQQIEDLVLRNSTLGGLKGVRALRKKGAHMAHADPGDRRMIAERLELEVDVEVVPCQGDPSKVYDLKTLNLRFDLPGKGEPTTLTSATHDGEIQIVAAP